MTHTEVTTTSWGSRLGDSFKGILFGILLFIAGTALLYWNEGRTVKSGDAIAEARAVTTPIADISRIDPALAGTVIHASGRAETTDTLTDPIFGVSTTAIKLSREVEYYQWVEKSKSETRKKVGGGEETVTTYSYEQQWTADPVPSGGFRDATYQNRNFVRGDFKDETIYASRVTFGAYVLPQFMVTSISGSIPLEVELPDEKRKSLEEAALQTEGRRMDLFMSFGAGQQYVHTQSNVVYLGASPGSPEVGDVRITFTQVPPAEVSIVGKVIGDTFEPFIASNGYSFSRLDMGRVSADNMFADAESENKIMAWILRVVGVLIVIAGLSMVLRPLSVLADVLPLLGDLVGAGTGLIATLIGGAWSCIIIAIAWIRFRPTLAFSLIGAAVVLLVAVPFMRRRKKVEQVEQTGQVAQTAQVEQSDQTEQKI